jgi:hypothetical protein
MFAYVVGENTDDEKRRDNIKIALIKADCLFVKKSVNIFSKKYLKIDFFMQIRTLKY